jgi:hypothetical protein
VRRGDTGLTAQCSCGYASLAFSGQNEPCLLLALHLQAAVRGGAAVTDDGDGLAGVREPRRPLPPHDHGSAAHDVA